LAEWRAHGVGLDTVLRIDVSPAQLVVHDLVNTIQRTLEKFGLGGSSIGLEITESMLIRDLVNARAALVGLREIGVDIAIDDFGTGYSGISLLTSLPVGSLKIDRGFVLDLATSADDLVIVRAVVGLARALDIDVVRKVSRPKARRGSCSTKGVPAHKDSCSAGPAPPERPSGCWPRVPWQSGSNQRRRHATKKA
jgi:EAL domain-containing protein (putative c-di-GMP-specific phosphodiesterase class I)